MRIFRWIAWGMFGLALLEFAGMLVLEASGCQNLFNPSHPEPAVADGIVMLPLNALGFCALGALVISDQPENRIGWLSIILGVGLQAGLLGSFYGLCTIAGPLDLPWAIQALEFENIANLTFFALIFFLWLFPDGRFLSPGWRRLGLTLLSIAFLFAVLSSFWPGPFQNILNLGHVVDNPYVLPITPTPFWDAFVFQGNTLATVSVVLSGIISLIQRWRRADGIVRQQMMWLTFFLMTSGFLFIAVEFIGVLFYPAIFKGWFYLAELAIFWLGFPVVLGFAIFRFRLYDIDLIIRRTLVYALLTGLLAIVYFGSVLALQSVITAVGGQQSAIVTVISTLAIAALFTPLRRRVQDFIDRRFFRAKYDAEQTLAAFANTARDEVDMERQADALVGVVEDTMQPESVSLWLRKATVKHDT